MHFLFGVPRCQIDGRTSTASPASSSTSDLGIEANISANHGLRGAACSAAPPVFHNSRVADMFHFSRGGRSGDDDEGEEEDEEEEDGGKKEGRIEGIREQAHS